MDDPKRQQTQLKLVLKVVPLLSCFDSYADDTSVA